MDLNKYEDISEDVKQNKIVRALIDITDQQTQTIRSEINGIKTILNTDRAQTQKDLLWLRNKCQSEINGIKTILNTDRAQTQKDLLWLRNKCQYLEKAIKRNNIIIFGLNSCNQNILETLNSCNQNILETVVDALNTHMGLDICANDVDDIYSIGDDIYSIGGREVKPIIVKFVSYLKKREVLKKVKLLKGSNIAIAEDLPYEERQKNKILRKHLHKARSSNLNAYIRGGKLYVNGEAFTSEQLAAKEGEDTFDVSLEQRPSSAPPTPDTRDSNLVGLADASPSNNISGPAVLRLHLIPEIVIWWA
ncbi:hypothetical protein QE152_g9367 [Popillia japonica]|uniref:Uncharacterized protein n=1 Tax=Popillia japonica TaxID=7064 RepID=A0AAW1LY90_POPJA